MRLIILGLIISNMVFGGVSEKQRERAIQERRILLERYANLKYKAFFWINHYIVSIRGKIRRRLGRKHRFLCLLRSIYRRNS